MPVPIKTFEIKIGGKLYTDYTIIEAVLSKELLKPNKLEFSMRKKKVSRVLDDVKFNITDKLLGASVALSIETDIKDKKGNDASTKLSFEGIIFNINSTREMQNDFVCYKITAFSPDHLLNDNPHCFSYEEKTLKDIVLDSIKDYTKDITGTIDPKMDKSIPYVVQYNETTYGFLSRLAQRYGEFFYFEDGKMVFGKINEKKSITLNPGIELINYKYELNLSHINFTHYCHDYLEYKNDSKNAKDHTKSSLHKLTDYAYNHSDSAYKKLTVQNLHSATQEDNSTKQLDESLKGQGLGNKSRMMICRAGTHRADLQIGSKIKIHESYDDNDKGSETDQDEQIICEITHKVNISGKYENEIMAIPANADYPPYSSSDVYPYTESQRAKVMDNKDPEKLGRIRVQFIWQEMQDKDLLSPWLRIVQPYGGGDKGFYYIPEIDEEVMVAFENGNAEKPYVSGTLYHGKQKPESGWYSGSNDIKAIRTRNGHTIEIHDADPGGFISIYDNGKNNYKLTFSTDNKLIKLESTGNIELVAGNDIIMTAKNNIEIKAQNKDISVDAKNNISIQAGQDMTEMVKNNMKIQVSNDQTIEVKGNQTVNVTKDKNEKIDQNYILDAADISETASGKMQLSSQTHEQAAKASMKIDGGPSMDIKASILNVNS